MKSPQGPAIQEGFRELMGIEHGLESSCEIPVSREDGKIFLDEKAEILKANSDNSESHSGCTGELSEAK